MWLYLFCRVALWLPVGQLWDSNIQRFPVLHAAVRTLTLSIPRPSLQELGFYQTKLEIGTQGEKPNSVRKGQLVTEHNTAHSSFLRSLWCVRNITAAGLVTSGKSYKLTSFEKQDKVLLRRFYNKRLNKISKINLVHQSKIISEGTACNLCHNLSASTIGNVD
jgi:hypothetical protein